MQSENFLNLDGIEFVEFSSANPSSLEKLFLEFGFSKTKKHNQSEIYYFHQGDINFLLNCEKSSLSGKFSSAHGPSISAMGWRVKDAQFALKEAIRRGAEECLRGDYFDQRGLAIPAVWGIGNSVIYLIENNLKENIYSRLGFEDLKNPIMVNQKGFLSIDHLTNNVENGTMKKWSDFYKNIFGFKEVRYFDIRGAKTGLQSYALRSPCGKFCIPINEGTEDKSQINEYLREYKGPGVQHLAFLTENILESLKCLQGSSIETLDIDDEYYDEVFKRVPNVTEDHSELRKFDVLIDGDTDGYLLQIFTKNIIGPIFIEIIQRKNHLSFGEGNFGALFRSIERDQEKRGVL